MKQRPRYLVFLSLFFLFVAVSLPVQIMYLYEHPIAEIGLALEKLTILNWLVITFSLASAVTTFMVTRASKLLVPLLLLSVAINNYFVALYAVDFSPGVAYFASIVFAAITLPYFSYSVQDLVNSPKKRWWLTPARKRAIVPIAIGNGREWVLETLTRDISESGVFVPVGESSLLNEMGSNTAGPLKVRLDFGDADFVTAPARIVRQVSATGGQPGGIGLAFIDPSHHDRRRLKRLLSTY